MLRDSYLIFFSLLGLENRKEVDVGQIMVVWRNESSSLKR